MAIDGWAEGIAVTQAQMHRYPLTPPTSPDQHGAVDGLQSLVQKSSRAKSGRSVTPSVHELAWALADHIAPNLVDDDRTAVYVDLGCGNGWEAIAHMLHVSVRKNLRVPEALLCQIAVWLDGYAGTPDEPAIRQLLCQLQPRMSFYAREELRSNGWLRLADTSLASADEFLFRRTAGVTAADTFDVFLSHSFRDAAVMVGIVDLLEQQGLTVYVDWVVCARLDRLKVAALLRRRMRQCKSLIIATCASSPASQWMPWELGYFDGIRGGRIAILPLDDAVPDDQEREYHSLYPAIEQVWVHGKSAPAAILPDRKGFLPLQDFAEGSTHYRPLTVR
jgi:hypothetical protein